MVVSICNATDNLGKERESERMIGLDMAGLSTWGCTAAVLARGVIFAVATGIWDENGEERCHGKLCN